eukprot:gnl/TRDRNA2_/TRDRNA2_198868_c0_seq1.p1 gnl/TRDRNA2_/TRDRNA2_198868_c0~~gnl/TRDRNA2_/TRDRNA2_198868_c0_seq1.p1  ORF type:complete len:125 (+),score=10.63 gnl/TRDRNA2_/TRDRNA2_198868_c0_seq1:56-430(+)
MPATVEFYTDNPPVTDGDIFSLLARCHKKQTKLRQCASRWKESQMKEWDCGPAEWDMFVCAAAFVCPKEEKALTARCEAPAPGSPQAASGCQTEWWALRRCLVGHKLILRWNGERDCRSIIGKH